MLADEMKMYPQCLKNVRVKSKPDAQNDPDVQAAVKAAADALGESGRILVRESGTEPKICVMVEAESDEICEKYVDSVIDVIRSKGHISEQNELLPRAGYMLWLWGEVSTKCLEHTKEKEAYCCSNDYTSLLPP